MPGTLIRKVVDGMLDKASEQSPSQRKIFLYSGHELNIVAVLQTLNVWKPHIPSYSSAIIIELYEDLRSYYVKVSSVSPAQPAEMQNLHSTVITSSLYR